MYFNYPFYTIKQPTLTPNQSIVLLTMTYKLSQSKRTGRRSKPLLNPIAIVCHACALVNYWAGLFKEIDKEVLEAGVNTMLKIAASLLGKKRSRDGQQLLKNDDSGDKKE